MIQKKNIGVFAPSSKIDKTDIQTSKAFLEEKGYNVFIHPQTFAQDKQSAGTHLEKLSAFYDLWKNDNIDFIWAAGGGNRCLHWIDDIDYASLDAPKTVIGFSDVTALLNALYACKGFTSIHGPTFNKLTKVDQIDELFDFIETDRFHYFFKDAKIIREGKVEGHLIGGNLSLFQYLPHTLPDKFWQGGILFLEDCNEELSRVDRMILHLKRSGIFDDINGLILGQFSPIPETGTPFGFTLEDIIREHTSELEIPVIMNAPFGHGPTLTPLPIGKKVYMSGIDVQSFH